MVLSADASGVVSSEQLGYARAQAAHTGSMGVAGGTSEAIRRSASYGAQAEHPERERCICARLL